ncbi:MAG: isoprenyl transferase [Leptospiraceae bacterium]|nr:isoprenyl transferase [Leptospiraceae bacterium]
MESELPSHVAIIMDGNGRWATSKNLPRKEGHKEGSLAIHRLMDVALKVGLKNISLYAFSTENWKRPISEITAIFELLDNFIAEKLEGIHAKKIRVKHSGSRGKIPSISMRNIDKAIELTKENDALTINFCLNYGGQEEILNAFHSVMKKRSEKKISLLKDVSVEELEAELYTSPLPPVDLLIRTAGEQRISNFLLWQSAYAEIYFTETLWPDFNEESLFLALDWYKNRIRKFGGL